MRSLLASGLILLTAACAGMGGGGDAGMSYGVPEGNPLVYERGDSVSATVTVPGMGSIGLDFDQSMTLNADFLPSAAGAAVAVEILDYSGTIRNPAMGTTRARAENVSGILGFILDATGRVEITDSPSVTGAAGQMFRATALAHEFLPRLPGGPVVVGASWTDTIQYDESTRAGDLDVVWVVTYTVVGEDDFRGIPVMRVESDGRYQVATGGEMQGMYVEQELSGSESGYFLWDQSGRRVMMMESVREMDGAVYADVAPEPMQMTGTGIVRMVLRTP